MKFAANLVVFMLYFGFAFGQSNPRVDSLTKVLATQREDSHQVKTLNELFKAHLYSEPKKAHQYISDAYRLAKQIQWKDGMARMANNLGVYHSKQGNFDQALKYYEEVMQIRATGGKGPQLADVETNIAAIYFKKGQYLECLNRYNRVLRRYQQNSDTSGYLSALNNIATVRKELGDLPEAQAVYLQVLRVQEALGNKPEIGRAAINIGSILHQQRQYEASKIWYERGLAVGNEIGDNFMRASAYNNLGELLISQRQHLDALPLLDSSLGIASRTGDMYAIGYSEMLRSDIEVSDEAYQKAAKSLNSAISIFENVGMRQPEALCLYRLGNLNLLTRNVAAAVGNLQAAHDIALEINSPSLTRDVLERLSEAYAAAGDHARAYASHKEFAALDDSIYSAIRASKISEMHERYEAGQKQRIIDQQRIEHAEDELRIVRAQQGLYLLLAVVLVAAIALGFVFYLYKQRARISNQIAIKNKEIAAQRDYAELQNLRILQINANLEALVEARTSAVVAAKHELDTFLYESAHALRRPITRVDGLLDLIFQENDPALQATLKEKLSITLKNMDGLLYQLMRVQELSSKRTNLQMVHIHALVQEMVSNLDARGCAIHIDIPTDAKLESDKYFLTVAVQSLIENATLYHPSEPGHNPQVHISLRKEPSALILTVADNGLGIPEGMEDKIFEMFVRGTTKGNGNGLGLYLAKIAVEKIQAKLSYLPDHKPGAAFEISLPA